MSGDDYADVLVVGAGPVGLLLACELARRGASFRLIDRLAAPTGESRAVAVHARSLEMMERVGTVDALIASGRRTTAAEFHADGKRVGHIELDTVDSPYAFSVSTAQTETERVLTERLTELGGTIDRRVELVGLEQNEHEVRSSLRRPDGSEESFRSAFIAGTDGSHSTVRAQVGTELEGSFKGERFLLGDVEADYDYSGDAFHIFFSAGAPPLVLFPMLGERARLIAQLGAGEAEQPTLEHLQAICDERAPGVRLRSSHWITAFEIHHAQVPQYRHGRAFLAGDAAHVHSPAGGQGMNTGMQDAFNLGWKLSAAAAGRAAPGLLDSYQAERHPVAARVIKDSTRLTRAATLEHEFERKLRNLALRVAAGFAPVRRKLADQTEETDITYAGSPIVAGSGEAAPDVPGLEPALHSALAAGNGHTALYIAGSEGQPSRLAADQPDLRHLLVGGTSDGFDDLLPDPERRVAERYGAGAEGALVIVRPDGYIGLRTELGNDEAVRAYFERIFVGN
jgi:2-polyprenyl-6-methoxyphenol hydroxylase-like FAD-dependent oxidoreductase